MEPNVADAAAPREFVDTDLSRARFVRVNLSNVVIRDSWLVDADIDGVIRGLRVNGVDVFPLRDGLIAREVAYWAKPFPAPDWRAAWVERM